MSMRTFKVLGFLLTYPTAVHREALAECRAFLKQENVLSAKMLESLNKLITEMEETDILDLQEAYVALFDRTPSCPSIFLSIFTAIPVSGDRP